jgi:hypothetical protein
MHKFDFLKAFALWGYEFSILRTFWKLSASVSSVKYGLKAQKAEMTNQSKNLVTILKIAFWVKLHIKK